MPLEWMAAAPHVAYAVHMNESKSLPRKASFWKTEPFKLIELREVAAPDGIENEGTTGRVHFTTGARKSTRQPAAEAASKSD